MSSQHASSLIIYSSNPKIMTLKNLEAPWIILYELFNLSFYHWIKYTFNNLWSCIFMDHAIGSDPDIGNKYSKYCP